MINRKKKQSGGLRVTVKESPIAKESDMKATISPIRPEDAIELLVETIVDFAKEERWLLGSGRWAHRAFSCVIRPEVGDHVLCSATGESSVIVAIIRRSGVSVHEMSLPGNAKLRLSAEVFSVVTKKLLELKSFGNIQIEAPLGSVATLAADVFYTARKTLVQVCSHLISKTKSWQLSAEGSVLTDAENHIMTARRDIKIDAERINMG